MTNLGSDIETNITIDTYISKIDGTPVVHIDTPNDGEQNNNGPILRVYINDDTDNPVFDNPKRV